MGRITEYWKGILATLGATTMVVLETGTELCDTVWPNVVAILTAILVVAVPNTKNGVNVRN